MKIRAVRMEDVAQITAIYGEQVLNNTSSFELEPPSVQTMQERVKATLDKGLPYLVAAEGDEILGYAYAGLFHQRAAYGYTLEDSIYMAEAARGKGYGKLLLNALIDDATQKGYRQMISIIGGSDNAGSIGLHKACGFEMIGTLKAVGWKHGKWADSVYMQLPLGEGNTTPIES